MGTDKCPNPALLDSALHPASIQASLGAATLLVLLGTVPTKQVMYNAQQLTLCWPLLGSMAHTRRQGVGQLQPELGVKYCNMYYECVSRAKLSSILGPSYKTDLLKQSI